MDHTARLTLPSQCGGSPRSPGQAPVLGEAQPPLFTLKASSCHSELPRPRAQVVPKASQHTCPHASTGVRGAPFYTLFPDELTELREGE